MKFVVVALSLVALSCCLFSSTEAAAGQRQKRSLAQVRCPENATYKQCVAYAEEKLKTTNYCHRFVGGDKLIEWQTCGIVSCGENSKLVAEDLSKPYPECCERCEIVDASKPAEMSGVL